MIQFIIEIDQQLFLILNSLHSEAFDGIMTWISGKTTWWPFYLLLLAFLAWKMKLRVIVVLLFVSICITLTDQSSVHLFKEVFERLRPCREPELQGMVHLVNGKCGGMYGFVSSHAANAFGVAMLLSMIIRKWWFISLLMLWAALVGYSRVYLGLHYPGDIVGGAWLGLTIGFLVFLLYNWFMEKSATVLIHRKGR